MLDPAHAAYELLHGLAQPFAFAGQTVRVTNFVPDPIDYPLGAETNPEAQLYEWIHNNAVHYLRNVHPTGTAVHAGLEQILSHLFALALSLCAR